MTDIVEQVTNSLMTLSVKLENFSTYKWSFAVERRLMAFECLAKTVEFNRILPNFIEFFRLRVVNSNSRPSLIMSFSALTSLGILIQFNL